MKTWTSKSTEDLPQIASELIAEFPEYKIVLFVGKMGAGKTTFIQAICKSLSIEDDVNSPTFALVNEYSSRDESRVYHFDFYRIESESEAYDMGFYEYLDSGNYCLIEWPDRVEGLLPNSFLLVNIAEKNGTRSISANPI